MTSPPTTTGPRIRIDLGDLGCVRASVAHAPYVSVLGVMKEVMSGHSRGLPADLTWRVARSVSAAGHHALAPMHGPGSTVVPDCLHPGVRLHRNLADSLADVRDQSPADASASILAEFTAELPTSWRQPATHTRRWLDDVATAAAEVARSIAPEWRTHLGALDAEMDRVERALESGRLDLVLNSLNPRLEFKGGTLSFDDATPVNVNLDNRALIMVPMFGGARLLYVGLDGPHTVVIGYPVPRRHTTERASGRTALTELLGETRTQLLLALTTPTTAGVLARTLGCAPSSLSFHLDRLEAADLIERQRAGNRVMVRRSARADALLDVMSATASPRRAVVRRRT